MKKSPDTLYVAKNRTKDYPCTASRHTVKGGVYDFWVGNSVKSSTDYNVVEYHCSVPESGTYDIFPSNDLQAERLGSTTVSQYDTHYDVNESGAILYGFALLTGRTYDRFPLSSDKWYVQIPHKDNYNSKVTVHFPDSWSIITSANHHGESSVDSETKARAELDGHFTYAGNDPRTVYIDYHAGFYMRAYAPWSEGEGGGNSYSEVTVGIYDVNASKVVTESTKLSLHASTDHPDLKKDPADERAVAKFMAEPGKTYYIFFDMLSHNCCLDGQYAKTNLNSIFHLYVKFRP